MSKSTNRVCYTCGKEYYFCGNCPEHKGEPAWKNIVCCDMCNEIFTICAQYNLGYLSKSEARSALNVLHVKGIEYASKSINETIKKIYLNDKKSVKSQEPDPEEASTEDMPETTFCE